MLFHYGICGNAIKYNYDRNEVVVKTIDKRANLGAPVVPQQQL
jgi:hypothetical protein